MMILKNEINWLTRHFKNYSIPLVVYNSQPDWWAGCYEWPSAKRLELNGYSFDRTRGIIVLGRFGMDQCTIAHEYRHHLQYMRYGTWYVPENIGEDENVKNAYYNNCRFEHDAIRFETYWGIDKISERYIRALNLTKMSRSETLNIP